MWDRSLRALEELVRAPGRVRVWVAARMVTNMLMGIHMSLVTELDMGLRGWSRRRNRSRPQSPAYTHKITNSLYI